MPELKIDVVKPNLQVQRNEDGASFIYSLRNADDVFTIGEIVDDVVKRHVDERGLRARESDYQTLRDGKAESSFTYIVPLRDYLKLLRSTSLRSDGLDSIGNEFSKLFGIYYAINACTHEDPSEMEYWQNLGKDLKKDPKELFGGFEDGVLLIYDRDKTLKNMKRYFEELDAKIPDLFALNNVFKVESERFNKNYIGHICLRALREKGKEKTDRAASELVEKLKEFEGPCLSFDTLSLSVQRTGVLRDAAKIVNNYGDILLNPNWQERFFRFDP